MRLVVTGARGQVGFELARSLQPLGEVIALDRTALDLSAPASLAASIAELRPDVLVNAAAYTAVDRAEQEAELAMRINGEAPGVLARAARDLGALFVHYSTDYVFDGSGTTPWPEDAPTGPLNVYGASKLAGEQAIAAAGGDWLVLRTSWVYSRHGGNFPRTILRLAQERERLTIVADQFGVPTSARFIADATAQIVPRALAERSAGTFTPECMHLVAAGETHWLGVAQAVCDAARRRGATLRTTEVSGIPSSAYPTPARRPANSRLSLSRLSARYGIMPPPWQTGIELLMDELIGPLPAG